MKAEKQSALDCKIIDLEGYRAEKACRSANCYLDSIRGARIRIPKDLNDWLKCGEVVEIKPNRPQARLIPSSDPD